MFEYGVHPHQGRRTGDLIRAKNPPMTKGKPGTRYFLEKPLGEGADDGPKRMVERHGGSEGKKSVHEIAIDQGSSRNKPSRGWESTVASPFQSTYAVSSAGRGREAPQRRLLFCLSLSLSLAPTPPPLRACARVLASMQIDLGQYRRAHQYQPLLYASFVEVRRR